MSASPAPAPAPAPSPESLLSVPAQPGYPRPPIVARGEWGSRPADESRMKTHEIHAITLHHGGVVWEGKPDAPTSLRNLQSWGMRERNWGDIPYHFQIDLEGVIYECRELRFAGDTNTAYNPAGQALPCLMGNYEEQVPNEKQLDAVVDLCAWLCSTYGIPPGSIKGHKDWVETLCPGKNFYPYITDGTISRRVAERLARGGWLKP